MTICQLQFGITLVRDTYLRNKRKMEFEGFHYQNYSRKQNKKVEHMIGFRDSIVITVSWQPAVSDYF